MGLLDRALNMGESRRFKDYEKRVSRISAFADELEEESLEELRERMDSLREHVRGQESEDKIDSALDHVLPECFAVVRELGRRTMNMRHFDVQLIGGMVLHGGAIAEMKTGEGKTLTGTLSVILNSLAGRGVHVVTVNDYLARRDAEWMMPLYEACGVSVGILQNNMHPDDKVAAYAADVTYGTNSEFGFDYLRDNMAQSIEEKVQHGGRLGEDGRPIAMHWYSIVDEVDNILIDEARTPLIISGAPEQAAEMYVSFAKLAKTMESGKTPEGMDPRMKKDFVAEFDFEFDEKHKTVAVSEQGVEKAEKFLGIEHLYRAENGPLVNHLIQSLKAESLYKRDVDYAVIDGEVKIIDEFTGRILDGRRWSEGLHQAIEAKEGVAIREENVTLATITLQNYFRMYRKMAGMTGTALTEATEFMKIYKLPVVQIPTNRPMVRKDQNDQIYKTKDGKWSALVREIEARHERGQPVLVGTISVEVSEMLSAQLRSRGIKHAVLNAKPEHAQGVGGGVPSAPNRAGGGFYIKRGGTPPHRAMLKLRKDGVTPGDNGYEEKLLALAAELEPEIAGNREKVMEAGGLFICGTERHESRRIDNQLRGRAGRQGDPGESRFFLSAEDDLVRLFAGDRIYRILDRLGTTDDEGHEEPIEAKMLSKQIEKAQQKVEEQNFLIRKRTLEYDDVMNEQRRVIYKYRDEVLEGQDMGDTAREQLGEVIERLVVDHTYSDFVEDWDLEGLFTALRDIFPAGFGAERVEQVQNQEELIAQLSEEALALYDGREQELSPEVMRQLERFLLLQIIDEKWREHLYDMDYLREGIHLRGFAQIEPIVAYKNEAFTLFTDLMNTIWSDFARMIFHIEVQIEQPVVPQPEPQQAQWPSRLSYSGGTESEMTGVYGESAAATGVLEPEQAPVEVTQRRVGDHDQLGRNEPCWCGSGKKYKKCHGQAA